MTADIPTLLLMIVVSSVVVAGALLVLNGNQRRDGLQYWAIALLLSSIAHALLLLYGRIPNLLTVVLGNALLASGLGSFLLAVRRFYGLTLYWWRLAALVALVALVMFIYQHQFVRRVAFSSVCLGAQTAWVLWVLLRNQPFRESNFSRGALLLASGLGLILATMLLRGTAAIFFSLDIATVLQSNLVQTLTFMVSFLASLVCSFGFVFMAKERADAANVRLAKQDALTGVANRRVFFERLEAELARSRRHGNPLSLMMVDVDHFKQVNDQHGHGAGDRLLVSIAQTMARALRADDVLGRMGGEEFAAVLPGVSPTEAQAIAERVRSAVERQALDATQGGPQRATVSIGLVHSATLGADADMDTLLPAADTALYRAKAEGRNRVMVG